MMQTKVGSVKLLSCIWSKELDQSKLEYLWNVYDSWELPIGMKVKQNFSELFLRVSQ